MVHIANNLNKHKEIVTIMTEIYSLHEGLHLKIEI